MQFKLFRGDDGAVAGGMDSSPGYKGFWRGCTCVSWTGGVLFSVRNLITRGKCFTWELPIPVHAVSQINKKIENMKVLNFSYSAYLQKETYSYWRMASSPCHWGKESENKESQVLQIRKCQEGSTSPPSSLRYKLWQRHHCDLEPGGRE